MALCRECSGRGEHGGEFCHTCSGSGAIHGLCLDDARFALVDEPSCWRALRERIIGQVVGIILSWLFGGTGLGAVQSPGPAPKPVEYTPTIEPLAVADWDALAELWRDHGGEG